MFGSLIDGLLLVMQWKVLFYMLIGCAVGFWVGILPGIGGAPTMAIMLSFIYKMTPPEALAFLLGMHSVCSTTGDITSILVGIPGEGTCAATILDGYPMAQKGEAGRALGAALMSSLVGAVIGAFCLAVAIPIIRPLVLSFGTPEMFMMIVVGLTCIVSLSGRGKRQLMLGMLAGGFGFLLSMVGTDPYVGIHRYTFGQIHLWQGIPLVPLLVGIFAIPEVVELTVKGTPIAGDYLSEKLGKGVMEGIKDTFHHFWLVVRCSILGAWVGILPGFGGGVAQWIAYAHATQSAKTTEEQSGFGKGDIRGVLGPGAANNSKEGGGLIPTVAFGIPSGGAMAVLLGGLLLLGITPGPDMLTKFLPLTFSLVWTIVLANISVVAVSLLFINRIARMTTVRGNLIIPFIILLSFIGAYSADDSYFDLLVLLSFGGFGYLMVKCDWPRPPFILGFVLGELAETYLGTSISRYGAEWLLRPKVIIIFCLAVGVALYPFLKGRKIKKREVADEI